jgi:hypothetical protein
MSPAATQPFPITQNGWVGVVSISSSSTQTLTITLVSFTNTLVTLLSPFSPVIGSSE